MCNKRVFVVDDEPNIADTLGLILQSVGFVVHVFYDGLAALEHSQHEAPDIVLSDIMMPRMDGLALATKLREQLPECRVLLISGNAMYTSNPDYDTFEILAKPVPPKTIISKVIAMAAETT
jgi:CheY-like chemotaxis protein